MKNVILFALLATLLMSCGGSGQLPSDNITWGQAFDHVSKSFGYWLFVILAFAAIAVYVYRTTKSKDGWNGTSILIFGAFVAILLASILLRPSEVAANTTVEQAARGVYIGY